MKTIVISVGKELLTGKTVNTNLTSIASRLHEIGISVQRSIVIDDVREEYHKVLDCVDENIIIFTGGLGPTIDDITRETVIDYFKLDAFYDKDILAGIERYFTRMGLKMKDTNNKQAYRPVQSTIIINSQGTAPGLYFEVDNKVIVLLPGPPNELIPMLEQTIDLIKEKQTSSYVSKGFKLVGTGESHMEKELEEFYPLHPNVSIAPYAGLGEIKYVFTSKNPDDLERCMTDFHTRFEGYIYGGLQDTLEGVVVEQLRQKNYTISFAESCTGGLLASTIVNVSGSSEVFKNSYVTYSNQSKIIELGVSKDTLQQFGAVSQECVKEMAEGLKHKTHDDVTVSISGIAGPTGGSKDKPVGLVYFGLCHNDVTKTYHFVFNGDRAKIRQRSVIYALNLIRRELNG